MNRTSKEGTAACAPLLLGGDWQGDEPGGLNRYLFDLLRALHGLGVPASATLVGPALTSPVGTAIAPDSDRPWPVRLCGYRQVALRAARRADVIDAHFALYALGPVVLGRLGRQPFVVHFQGPWADEDFREGPARALRVSGKRLVELAVYRRADALVTLSSAFKRILVERYGITPWKIEVIPPGVDLARFQPSDPVAARRRLALEPERPVVLCVRRLVPRMGIDVLIDAWSAVVAAHPTSLLLIAGEGSERTRLEAKVAATGLAPSVRFLGRVDEATLVDLYRAADLSVVPTVALEGFGLVVLESLACGTPALTSDNGGLPEVVAPLDRGLIVPAGDARALSERVSRLLDDPALLPTPDRCRRYAESFAWDAIARRHVDLYRCAVERRAPRPPRIKVVFLDHCARLSGGELALLRLLPALTDVDVHVILAEDGPLVGRLLEAGVSAEVLPLVDSVLTMSRDRIRPGRVPATAALRASAYTVRVARRLRRLGPDLIHTNSLKSAVYGGLAGRLANVPVVWHIRDRIAADYLPVSAVRTMRALARRVPAAVIANSEATLATLGRRRSGWAVVPSPLGALTAPAAAIGARSHRSEGLRVGMVGRLAPWKGQHVFLQAFAEAFPNGESRASLIGSALFGEERYADQLVSDAHRLGIADRVDFRGFREDVAAELAQLDVLVHASTVPEPFGQVVVEGMACGLPVIASAAGGPAEIIRDGHDGILSPPGDVAALAGHLRRLAQDPALRDRLGQAARARAEDYRVERVAPLVMEVYAGVLGAAK